MATPGSGHGTQPGGVVLLSAEDDLAGVEVRALRDGVLDPLA